MKRDCDTCRYFNTDFDQLPCSACSRFSKWETATNADHIRSMTDEELAVFIANIFENGKTSVFAVYPELRKNRCGLDWLKQPYEDRGG